MLALMMCAVLSAQVNETITVSRVLVDVRVTKFDGEPVTDLKPDDFNVRIGGKRAVVESVEWIEDGVIESSSRRVDEENATTAPRRLEDSTPRPPRPPRLFVFFVQTGYARETARIEGQMAFLPFAQKLADSLAAEDRVAVFSFDSHLKFRLDFTTDRAAIRAAITDTLWSGYPPPPAAGEPALGPHLDRQAMRDAAYSETGLLLVAKALQSLPGSKTIMLLGWGLGELTSAGVQMKWQWKETRAALEAARISIFALDTTDADSHTLEAGLRMAAEETGGLYAKTHLFPGIALDRVQRTLSGHYELELRAPEGLDAGSQSLDVRVKKRAVHVLAPASVLIRR